MNAEIKLPVGAARQACHQSPAPRAARQAMEPGTESFDQALVDELQTPEVAVLDPGVEQVVELAGADVGEMTSVEPSAGTATGEGAQSVAAVRLTGGPQLPVAVDDSGAEVMPSDVDATMKVSPPEMLSFASMEKKSATAETVQEILLPVVAGLHMKEMLADKPSVEVPLQHRSAEKTSPEVAGGRIFIPKGVVVPESTGSKAERVGGLQDVHSKLLVAAKAAIGASLPVAETSLPVLGTGDATSTLMSKTVFLTWMRQMDYRATEGGGAAQTLTAVPGMLSRTLDRAIEQALQEKPLALPKRIEIQLTTPPGSQVTVYLTRVRDEIRAQLATNDWNAMPWLQAHIVQLRTLASAQAVRWMPVQFESRPHSVRQETEKSETKTRDGHARSERSTSRDVASARGHGSMR